MADFYPYSKPQLSSASFDAVKEVLESDWLTNGPKVDAFQQALAGTVQAEHAIVCSSGSTALQLAVCALSPKPDETVLVTANSFLATASVIHWCGAKVAFIDVDPTTGLVTRETLTEAIEKHQSQPLVGLIYTDFAGQCPDLAGLYDIAKQRGLWLIEDAAHAFGSHYVNSQQKRLPIGNNQFSDCTVFSFNAIKNLPCGEGGAVTTASPALAEKIQLLRAHGMVRDETNFQNRSQAFTNEKQNPWYYEMQLLGHNFRLSDIHCALGLSQLHNIPKLKENRRDYRAYYQQLLADIPYVQLLHQCKASDPFWHLCVLLIDFAQLGIDRARLMLLLNQQGIGTQVHYLPIYRHPYFEYHYGEIRLPGTEQYYQRCLTIPLYHHMSEADLQKIGTTLLKALTFRSDMAKGGLC